MSTSTQPTRTTEMVPPGKTGFFSDIVLDYVKEDEKLKPFFEHPVSWNGLKDAMAARDAAPVNRAVLVGALKAQYAGAGVELHDAVQSAIDSLNSASTYTVCTAHQPNIFTGYLYFIYKIVHVIKLAAALKDRHPEKTFVPVYYMGSEDADLDELGKIFLSGEKLVWNTSQTGAVGRMKPTGLDALIRRIEGELAVLPFGPEAIELLKMAYVTSPNIQTATLKLVHELFKSYGLVVLIADRPELKQQMLHVFEDDLFSHTPSRIVEETAEQLTHHYKVQANPRAINLFYLKDDIRNRFEEVNGEYVVVDTNIRFSKSELQEELQQHPERFSPNVILRGLYQESILPNIAFVGGGGELAYWLELKRLFNHYNVPYPVQILRNSFLFIPRKAVERMEQLGFEPVDFFQPADQLLNELVKRESAAQVHLTNELRDTTAFYAHLKSVAGAIDPTLTNHVAALETRNLKQLKNLEKKMLRAEKRKFTDQSQQLQKLRQQLFPNNSLQERVENFLPFYAQYGAGFIQKVMQESPLLEQQFVISFL